MRPPPPHARTHSRTHTHTPLRLTFEQRLQHYTTRLAPFLSLSFPPSAVVFVAPTQDPMGKCLIGIQIYPVERAEAQPAGMGRSEPNDSPFLPPPNGRLQFGWNPISMLSQLLGPRLCGILCCCLCCGLLVIALIVFQPFLNLWIALANT